jgi:hypothetical protein
MSTCQIVNAHNKGNLVFTKYDIPNTAARRLAMLYNIPCAHVKLSFQVLVTRWLGA